MHEVGRAGSVVTAGDFVRIQMVLDRLTYKDGWRFALGTAWAPRLYLHGLHTEPDSRDGHELPGFMRTVQVDWPVDRLGTEGEIVAWVRSALQEWEVHEMNEWLRLDGDLVHDPHACVQCRIGGCRG